MKYLTVLAVAAVVSVHGVPLNQDVEVTTAKIATVVVYETVAPVSSPIKPVFQVPDQGEHGRKRSHKHQSKHHSTHIDVKAEDHSVSDEPALLVPGRDISRIPEQPLQRSFVATPADRRDSADEYDIPPTKVVRDNRDDITDTLEDTFAGMQDFHQEHLVKNQISMNVMKHDESELLGCWKRLRGRGFGDAATYCAAGQEKSGLLCYPKCKKDFYGIGPVCWSNKGGSIRSHGRGFGNSMSCRKGQDGFAGMCYQRCPKNFTGFLAFCSQTCPVEYPVTCGALCFKDQQDCNKMILQISTTIMSFLQGLLKTGTRITQMGIDGATGNPLSLIKDSLWLVDFGGDVQQWLGSLLDMPIGKLGFCL